jgi:DsbE subfamily thiol:disulfide oxidoreductase
MKRAGVLVGGGIFGFILGMILVYLVAHLQAPLGVEDIYPDPSGKSNLVIGTPAPDFELESISGVLIKLSDYQGKVVLVNFWATWCAPCRLEMPLFQSHLEQNPHDLVILAINAQDSRKEVAEFMEEMELTFEALIDIDGKVHRDYHVRGFPTTYILDRNGVLKFHHVGLLVEGQLTKYLEELDLDG